MEEGDDHEVYETELAQLFSEEDEVCVYIHTYILHTYINYKLTFFLIVFYCYY